MDLYGKKCFWTQETTLDLIELYKKHPVLYVTKDGNYKNRLKRLDALRDIRNEMFKLRGRRISIEDIKKKIHGLRTQYSFQLAKIRKSKLNGETLHPTLWCFSQLEFLRHTAAVKNAVSTLNGNQHQSTSKSQEEDSTQVELTNNIEHQTIEESQDIRNFYSSDCDPLVKEEYEDEFTAISSPAETTFVSSGINRDDKTEDDLTIFGRLVELELRKVSNFNLLRKAKRDILNILMDTQENCENDNH